MNRNSTNRERFIHDWQHRNPSPRKVCRNTVCHWRLVRQCDWATRRQSSLANVRRQTSVKSKTRADKPTRGTRHPVILLSCELNFFQSFLDI